MSYERDNIDNFGFEFDKFSRNWDNWENTHNPSFSYLKQFNTKLRMPFAIKQIELDYEFLREKMDDMKELHKFLYKLTDLWFAYEAFFKFYQKVNGSNINSTIVWLDHTSNQIFKSNTILNALSNVNLKLNQEFNSQTDKTNFKKYIQHCINFAQNGQKGRLISIVNNFGQDLSIKDILTLTYSIRNNYVHNGETTITNAGLDNLSFRFDETQKLKLVNNCYNFLAIFTVNIANTLIEHHS
jgi:hypothetical protein